MINGGSSTTPTARGPTGPSGGAPPNGDPPSGSSPANGNTSGGLVVPDLDGKTFDEAAAIVRNAGFSADLEQSSPVECDNPTKVVGKIRCQEPEAGKHVAKYTMIQVQVYRTDEHHGTLVRSQLDPLRGMTVAQAKAALTKLGFTGTVNLETPMQFIAKCGLDHVCDVQPESGVSTSGVISLVVNQSSLNISAPPPD